jgi:hypothetical protein
LSDPATLFARAVDLNRRADRLEDEGAIINLQSSYGYYVDRKMWDDVADLFANATARWSSIDAGCTSARRASACARSIRDRVEAR